MQGFRSTQAPPGHPLWEEQVLRFRRDVFKADRHPDPERAERDLMQWEKSVRRTPLAESKEDPAK